jgi:hypothetical protein
MIVRKLSYCFALLNMLFLIPRETFSSPADTTLFKLLKPSQTGISFNNKLTESDSLNILNQANIYNGGGVGIGDFNKDGLPDIYFSGNMVSNKLYLNKGSMKFSDVTQVAAVTGNGHWCTGVSVVDINADGWPDLYVSASFRKDPALRTNLLYINQGLNKDGIPTFKESAKSYGLDDTGFSTQAIFFDYDHDGDLDMYQVTNELYDTKTPIRFRAKVTDGSAKNTDRLYRNNGNETFTNVSKEAGITIEGWGHAVAITDINLDGWPDIYVANDFVSNDLLFINNKNGTFTNRLGEYFKHTGWNAMGTDIVDINNDGMVDIISLEMLPEDNLRKKRMLAGNEYYNYYNSQKFGYQHQYVRNVLQLNKGIGPEGKPVFSEVGYMAGIYETDWSWCPLVADFDNDGFKDIVITNGLPRDVTDLDYITFNNGQGGGTGKFTLKMVDSLPIVKLPDYSFRNTGGISFKNSSVSWGLNLPSFSNGGVYADLDNDNDLDLVINNINDPAFIYENSLNNKKERPHFLSLFLEGAGKNLQGFGATIRIYYNATQQQLYEHQPCRGYMSTVDYKAHIGLGSVSLVDSLRVRWADGKTQLLTNIESDQTISLRYSEASGTTDPSGYPPETSIFKSVSASTGIQFKHVERDAIDYNQQPSIPHKLSQYGPGIAVGDVDKNGFDDIFTGGSVGHKGIFFMQDENGKFTADDTRLKVNDNHPGEDMGVLFFDADNDGFTDLYIVSGSYELAPNQPSSQDVLYFNNGKGEFIPRYSALPKMFTNGSCVKAADIDGDGDLDLFVGGRVVSNAYPMAPRSYILMNYSGTFIDVTHKYCPGIENPGMVTDALWTDFDNDGKPDLVVTGEWMPVSFFRNTGTSLEAINNATGTTNHVGWWNSLVSGDFDNDGDIDYVAGNLGLNSNYKGTMQEPMILLAKDFDDNGLLDPLVFCYMKAVDGTRKPFPMTTRDDLISQMISIRKRFPTYKLYGQASMEQLVSKKDRNEAMLLEANDMSSSYFENKGNGHFIISPLPQDAQAAPVYGMISEDVDKDGNLDLLMVGNDYGMEPYSGRHDAFAGLYLKGNGAGNFIPVSLQKSGFYVNGDAKALASIHTAGNQNLVIATQNQDSLVVLGKNNLEVTVKWEKLLPDDFSADILYKDSRKKHLEFYYGSSYLSQSSRIIPIEKDVVKITITSFNGNKRELLK